MGLHNYHPFIAKGLGKNRIKYIGIIAAVSEKQIALLK